LVKLDPNHVDKLLTTLGSLPEPKFETMTFYENNFFNVGNTDVITEVSTEQEKEESIINS